jgi:hypothetical protein
MDRPNYGSHQVILGEGAVSVAVAELAVGRERRGKDELTEVRIDSGALILILIQSRAAAAAAATTRKRKRKTIPQF